MVFNWFSRNNIQQINASDDMTDNDIMKCSDIETLFLNNSKITDKGLQHLTKSLKVLSLGSCQITDDLLNQCINLTDLALQDNNLITDNGIQSLYKLEKLYLCNNVKITVSSLLDKKLIALFLGNNNNFNNESLGQLEHIIDLGIDRNLVITDDIFNYPNMKNIKSLDLEFNTKITGNNFDKLDNLTILNIKNNDLINANALYKLPNLQNLIFNSHNYLKHINNSSNTIDYYYKSLSDFSESSSTFSESSSTFSESSSKLSDSSISLSSSTFSESSSELSESTESSTLFNYLDEKTTDYQLINLLSDEDYNCLLINAIKNDNIQLVKYLIDNNYVCKNNKSHIIDIALTYERIEIAIYLIDVLENIILESDILIKFIDYGLLDIIKKLLNEDKIENNYECICEVLEYVIKNNNNELIKLIFTSKSIQNNVYYQIIYNNVINYSINYNNIIALEFLLKYDETTIIKLFFDKFINEYNSIIINLLLNDSRTLTYFNNWYVLKSMIKTHDNTLNILQIITNVDLSPVYQLKLLEQSVIYSNYLVAYHLLKYYHINLDNKYLLKALQNDDQDMFLLLNQYYKVLPENQIESLCLGCQNNMTKVVKNILEEDFYLFTKEDDEIYCMNMVIMNGNLELTKLLANHMFLDYENNLPLRIAIKHKHYKIVKFILNDLQPAANYLDINSCINLIIKTICENRDKKMLEIILNKLNNEFVCDKEQIQFLIRENEMDMFRMIKSKCKYTFDEEDICELHRPERKMKTNFL
jgi:hypothetical protein